MNKSQLDIEKIKRLYEFGALYYYEVQYFDIIAWKTQTALKTFSEEAANKEHAKLTKMGLTAALISSSISFNGAFQLT